MSRSRRKRPICGITTARSEKECKKRWHRAYRRKSKTAVSSTCVENPVLPDENLVGNPWKMAKDGKQVIDPAKNPEIMRK